MRKTALLRTSGLLGSSALILCAASAYAQEAAPAAAPAAPPPAAATPAPAAGPAPAPPPTEPSVPATPASPEAPAAAAPAEETFPAAWFRIDSDASTLQLWAGATHMTSDTFGIATDMYVNSGWLGEFDLGPSWLAGNVAITPMLGLQVDWGNHRANSLVPQLYITGSPADPIYMEFWFQNYENQVFDKAHGTNTAYFRLFVDYKINKYFAVGPEIEPLLALNDNAKVGDKALISFPVGVNVMLSNYGKNNNFFIYGGYETQDTPNDKHLTGRLTFVHNF